MIYSYRCPTGHLNDIEFPLGHAQAEVRCYACKTVAKRSYKDEHKQVSGFALMHATEDKERQGFDPRQFLPTYDDFRTSEDPSGKKGMNDWLETHVPAPGSEGVKHIDPRKL